MLIDVIANNEVIRATARSLAARGHQIRRINLSRVGDITLAGDACVVGVGPHTRLAAQCVQQLRRAIGRVYPIVVLIPNDDVDTKIELLRAGADDCLLSTCAPVELEVRIEVLVLHRARRSVGKVLRVGDLKFDLQTLTATRAGKVIHLFPVSRRLLEVLMAASPAVVYTRTLEWAVWGDLPPKHGGLRGHIYELRQSVDAGSDVKLIHAVRGAGYRLVDDVQLANTRRGFA
ncbi:DNA-binding response regulator, OmpR family, contains REC and winged-helix (wHTH) domain [Pseudoxanthomonas sp. GM95]|uniref:response regulator transcription factor n=1 Tax=Pseudoxanthomonas sp. GM95 TaxID=1881043 RepID=UPI0008D2DB80|nr:response regulator transcription factor [Pseudoxanthomonas sp. GM95]SEL13438.1 DNA-binding response regulator, OmpR family, contains REC and winged-helix (wHTH) domain [Pseudoxanthomonas sp. GM95]